MGQKIKSIVHLSPTSLGASKVFLPPPSAQEKPFEYTIKLLSTLKSQRNPKDKIEVLSKFRVSIINDLKTYRKQRRQFEKGDQYTVIDQMEDDSFNEIGAEDLIPVYLYVFIQADINNHYAQYNYINHWKENVELDPVCHVLTFYQGFLGMVMDIDPNISNESGLVIPPFVIANSLTNAIYLELRSVSRSDSNENMNFFWIPSVLVYLSVELGKSQVKARLEGSISGGSCGGGGKKGTLEIGDEVLMNSLYLNRKAVNCIFRSPPKDLGFSIEFSLTPEQELSYAQQQSGSLSSSSSFSSAYLSPQDTTNTPPTTTNNDSGGASTSFQNKNDSDGNDNTGLQSGESDGQQQQQSMTEPLRKAVFVSFSVLYPAHVYSDISLKITRFLRFEINN